jgi:shikimate kinase
MAARNLVLIGFMGVGKSTIGRFCAAYLGMEFRDSDAVIEARAGMPVAELFTTHGEARFRQLEREVVAELAASRGLVIATGGGVPLNPENTARLRAGGLVVLLRAAPETLVARLTRGTPRPLLANCTDPRARIEEMLAERAACYRAAAHCQVDGTGRSARQVARSVIALYEMTEPT